MILLQTTNLNYYNGGMMKKIEKLILLKGQTDINPNLYTGDDWLDVLLVIEDKLNEIIDRLNEEDK